jgi:glycosyltransferase involved in cell wall biosynthesis
MSCGCPIISTPIPHAKEILTEETGIIIDFKDSIKLADGVIRLLSNDKLRGKSVKIPYRILFQRPGKIQPLHMPIY